VYEYLDSTKILESGTGEDIAKARKEYWRKYKSEWRKRQNQKTRQVTVMLTPSEAKLIEDAAKKYKRSKPALIKAMCLAHMQKRYVVPDILAVNSIRELLAMNYSALKSLLDENCITYQAGITVMNQIAELEQRILHELRSPMTLEDGILDALHQHADYKETLYQLLKTHSP
jgi:hypothetical protein